MRRMLLLPFLLLAVPAAAQQQSEGYKLREAIKASKGNEVIEILDRPGVTVVNSRDQGSGDAAIHITARRGDEIYTRYLLQKGADPNIRDGRGDTPLMMAVMSGNAGLVQVLVAGRANVNLGNGSGETPLIRSVQRRDLAMVRALLGAGADPAQTDNIAGKSARDYAREDGRMPAIAKLLDEAKSAPRRAVAGPKL